MALEFPIKVHGESYVALLDLPDSGKEPIIIPGYDLEADIALAALGMGDSEALILRGEWLEELRYFLTHEDNLTKFLKELSRQGLDSLGLDEKKLGHVLSRVAIITSEDLDIRDQVDWEDFFPVVAKNYERYRSLPWDSVVILEYVERAHDYGNGDLLALLDELTKQELLDIDVKSSRCEAQDDGTAVTCTVAVEVGFLGNTEDEFTIKATGAYRNAELTDFDWEHDADEVFGPMAGTEELLEAFGEETDWAVVVEQQNGHSTNIYEPQGFDCYGDVAIFINGDLYERFTHLYDGEAFLVASLATIDREGLGDDVKLYMLRDDINEDDEDDFDEDDLSNWEEV